MGREKKKSRPYGRSLPRTKRPGIAAYTVPFPGIFIYFLDCDIPVGYSQNFC